MLMQIADVTYDPAAACPQWTERLELVQPDDEVRAVLPRMYGQTLTGLTDCEEFYVDKGRGGDGKTKTHEIMAAIHGDYYRHAGQDMAAGLVPEVGQRAPQRPGRLPATCAWSSATSRHRAVDVGWRDAQAGDRRRQDHRARRRARQPITFKPRGKLFVEVNPTPQMPGDDKGFRRRFRLTLWPVDLTRVPGGFEAPSRAAPAAADRGSGILNWLIAGCLDWLGDRRVPVPQRELEALATSGTGQPARRMAGRGMRPDRPRRADRHDRRCATPSSRGWSAARSRRTTARSGT
jgi:putative DNA primase/helicase